MRASRIVIFALFVAVSVPMMFLTGCRKDVGALVTKDSTEIKVIEEMQERGSDYRNSSNFELAIAIHDSCIQKAEAINDTIQLVIALNNQGTNYRRLSANKEASGYHYRALKLCDAYSDTTTFLAKKNRVRSLNGLGNVMLSLGNYEAAEKFFRSALAGETRLNSGTGQAINLANIGAIKEHDGELDSARIYYNLSMEKNREEDNKIGISLCYTYFGELDKKTGHILDAIKNYHQAYAVGCTTGDVWHELTPCLSLAEIYTDQNAVDSAKKYVNIGIEAAKNIHSNEHLRDFYGVRSRLEEKQGNVVKALADLKLCASYYDSVLSEEDRNSIQNARANYESSRRNVEVKAANEDAKTSRVIRNAVTITAILIVAFMIFAFWQYRRYVRMRHKTEREREIFVRNIAHQLRTPMTVVSGLVELLRGHISTDDVVGISDLDAAERQVNQLQTLILQLASKPKTKIAPLLKEMGDLAQESETDSLQIEGQGAPTILLAEDTDDVALMMCGLLRDNGYSVTRAVDGQEALDILQQQELPDLLITDIAMPRMDGIELMRHVRNDDTMCHLPIIVASARVEDNERMEGISAGAEVYLTKPFIPKELLLRVSTMLEQRERLRRSFSHVFAGKEEQIDSLSNDSANQKVVECKPQMNVAEKAFIDNLNKIIDENMLSGEVNVNFIAGKLCSSVSTINRKIKNITGMPVATYIRTRRMIVAKRLLATTNKPITEIEVLCGFNTPGHFSRIFKAETGMSPSEYRQKKVES